VRILHLATQTDLRTAERTGSYTTSTRGMTLEQQGFVHASTARQLPVVAEAIYADVTEPLVLLVLDVDTLEAMGSPVRWESPEGPGGAPHETLGLFPHVYGPVPVEAIVAVLPASFDAGRFVMPDLDGLDVAGADAAE